MIQWLLVFFGMIVFEAAWVLCVDAVAKNRAIAASAYGGVTWLIMGLTTVGYTTDKWLLIPTIAGACIGTYITMKGKQWILQALARFSNSAKP